MTTEPTRPGCVLGCGCTCGLCGEHTHVGVNTRAFGEHAPDCRVRTPSPREQALLALATGETPWCPHLFQVPAEGAYGPMTCPGGCHDEPCSTSGPYPIQEFPDLMEMVRVAMVARTLDRRDVGNDHPAIAWWKEHTGEDLLA